jgi:hypothetical protein
MIGFMLEPGPRRAGLAEPWLTEEPSHQLRFGAAASTKSAFDEGRDRVSARSRPAADPITIGIRSGPGATAGRVTPEAVRR